MQRLIKGELWGIDREGRCVAVNGNGCFSMREPETSNNALFGGQIVSSWRRGLFDNSLVIPTGAENSPYTLSTLFWRRVS